MSDEQKEGKISANQVFLFSKKIKNDGQIISTGPNAKTYIETEEYEGLGTIESHSELEDRFGWIKEHFVQLLIAIIGAVVSGLILYYWFGIGN